MKNSIRKIIAVLLAAASLLAISGCGNGSNGTSSENTAETSEYSYTSDFSTVDLGTDEYVTLQCYTEDGYYITYNEIVGQRELMEGEVLTYDGQLDIRETRLCKIGLDGSRQILDYTPIELDETADRNASNASICRLASNGKEIAVIEEVYEQWSDAPEGTEQYSDEWYSYYHYTDRYYLRFLNPDGTEKSCNEINVEEFGLSYFYPYDMRIADNGNVVLSCSESVAVLDSEGKLIKNTPFSNGWSDNLVVLSDGTIAASVNNGGYELCPVDSVTGEVGDAVAELPDYGWLGDGSSEYLFYYNNGSSFFGYNADTGKGEKLFNWISLDINPDNISRVLIKNDGTIIGVTSIYSSLKEAYINEQFEITKVLTSSLPQKRVITLAAQYLEWSVEDSIIQFNRTHDDVRIEVHDYSEYNTEDDYSAGLTKLTTELLSGNVPDILYLDGLPTDRLIAKGLLTDLYPFLDSDSELSRNSVIPSVLTALESGGCLYQTCASFSINTVVGAASVVGDQPGWTYSELYDALAEMPEECTVFSAYTTRSDILYNCLQQTINSYVNWETGECRFDSDDFIQLLKFADSFPSDFDWDNYDWSDDDSDQTRIMQGKQMLMAVNLSSFTDVTYYSYYFGGEGQETYIGYPTADGTSNGSTISLGTGYAITSACSDKEAAWDFVRTFFTEDYQMENIYSLPTNQAVFNAKLKEAMTPVYIYDSEGNKVPEPLMSIYINDEDSFDIYSVTQAEADKLLDLIDNTSCVTGSDTELFNIVSEQTKPFFEGQKSAEETARLIQSRVSLYVNEQR